MFFKRLFQNHSATTGISFGLTSAVITTLGLIVGLYSATTSRSIVLAGILTIAVADAFSDAVGIHLSEEFEARHSSKEIWSSTFFTFSAKLIFTLTFAVPIIFLSLGIAIWAAIFWGLTILSILSFFLARSQKKHPLKVIFEHNFIAITVIIITRWVGNLISNI